MNIKEIAKQIKLEGDAWIIVDYENRNPILPSLIGKRMLTRKLFLTIPADKKPFLIVHQIDTVYLQDKLIKDNFDLYVYKTYEEMLELEKKLFSQFKIVLMDISEKGLLPRVTLADYGSVSYIKDLGLEIKSSQNISQTLSAVISERGFKLQLKADELTLKIKDEAFLYIAKQIKENGESDELDVQTFIANRFKEEGMVFDEPPLVAIGKNASNPHYTPTLNDHSKILPGDLVLIDMWAKIDDPEGIYADITWMGYVGEEVPNIYKERFDIVKGARDAAISFLQKEIPSREVMGYEADEVAREYISKHGYGEYFIHRLGHSIYNDDSPHGPGANLDNYETKDTRFLLEGTTFSDEPGIYAPDFGMRSETNLSIRNHQLIVTAGLQEEIIPIMKLVK